MSTVTIPQITERLRELSADKLAVAYDFISYLAEREIQATLRETTSDAYQTMLASESVLQRDWDRPEEDAAWANL
jgi:hypothetical protein